MSQLGMAQLEGQSKQLEYQSKSDAARYSHQEKTLQMQLQAEIGKMEIELQRTKVEKQAEIANRLIDFAQHIYDRKMDAYMAMYQSVAQLIQAHHSALIEEQKDIKNQLFSTVDERTEMRLVQRQRELNIEIREMTQIQTVLSRDMAEFIERLSSDLPSSAQLALIGRR